MYREILLGISGVAIYPVVSLVLFTAAFAGVVFQVFRMDRARASRCAAMPLDDGLHAAEER